MRKCRLKQCAREWKVGNVERMCVHPTCELEAINLKLQVESLTKSIFLSIQRQKVLDSIISDDLPSLFRTNRDLWSRSSTLNFWILTFKSSSHPTESWNQAQDFSQQMFGDGKSVEGDIRSCITLLDNVFLSCLVRNDAILWKSWSEIGAVGEKRERIRATERRGEKVVLRTDRTKQLRVVETGSVYSPSPWKI